MNPVTDAQIRAALARTDALGKYSAAQTVTAVAQALKVDRARVHAIYLEGIEP